MHASNGRFDGFLNVPSRASKPRERGLTHVIDTNAETTLEGVYACGEIAGGTHGRNRMMGNSLLECVVFGRRAGRAAAGKAKAWIYRKSQA